MMPPFDFGQLLAGQEHAQAQEKRAGGLGAGLGRAFGTAATAAKGINSASQQLVRGAGGVVSGLGGGIDALGQATRAVGRKGMTLGTQAVKPVNKAQLTGILRDLVGALGHSSRLGGKLTHLTGRGISAVGQGVGQLGKGISYVADAPIGIPTVAAGGLLAAGANVAPKLPLPEIKFQSPVSVDVNYKTRRPVEFKW